MTSHDDNLSVDLAIIGAGMAGMSAAVMAIARGLTVAQAGLTGEILFSSGFLDFMSIHPISERRFWNNPWHAVQVLTRDNPDHPYARISSSLMNHAWDTMLAFFNREGLPYYRAVDENIQMITSQGTVKSTYCLPRTMLAGADGLKHQLPCLLVDFNGLRGFSAIQIAETLQNRWKNIQPLHLCFPNTDGLTEQYPEQMAKAMEIPSNREKLAEMIRPHLKDALVVGMPAIMGIENSVQAVSDLSERLDRPVFEIPTIPPSAPGIRLKETFERALPKMGVNQFIQKRVLRVKFLSDGCFRLNIGNIEMENTITARAVILATGRFFGGGLVADLNGIRESVMNLPVVSPPERFQWHRDDFFDPCGHPIHLAGIDVDDRFRPLNESGMPAYPNLFAAGSILAHQDWIRSKSGVGLAFCTAAAAVDACASLLSDK